MKLIDKLFKESPLATRHEITPKLGFALTVLLATVWLIPFLWMGVATLRPASDGINLMAELMPSLKPTLDNIRDAWEIGDFPRYTLNTIIICTGILLVQVFTITLAGFAFARLDFAGKTLIFYLFLMQLMLVAGAVDRAQFEPGGAARSLRHAHRRDDAVLRFGLRHLPDAASIRGDPDRVGRRGPDRRRQPASAHPPHLRAAVDAEFLGLRHHLRNQPLERLPVASDGHQLAGQAAAHGRALGVHRDRGRHPGLGHHRRGHADGDRTAAHHLPDLPETLHQL